MKSRIGFKNRECRCTWTPPCLCLNFACVPYVWLEYFHRVLSGIVHRVVDGSWDEQLYYVVLPLWGREGRAKWDAIRWINRSEKSSDIDRQDVDSRLDMARSNSRVCAHMERLSGQLDGGPFICFCTYEWAYRGWMLCWPFDGPVVICELFVSNNILATY